VLENSIFALLALFLMIGAMMVIWSRETILSAFGFLVAMLAIAGLFALLDNSFLFLAQIMVTAGAVVVLSLMVVTSINLKEENLPKEPYKFRWIVVSSILVAPFGLLIYRSLISLHKSFAEVSSGYGGLEMVGDRLFTDWVLPFEIVSVLLLAAMLAAIVIARKEIRDDS